MEYDLLPDGLQQSVCYNLTANATGPPWNWKKQKTKALKSLKLSEEKTKPIHRIERYW